MGCGAPGADKPLYESEKDIRVQAALVRLIQYDYGILVELFVVEALSEQRAICKRMNRLISRNL